MYGCRYCKMDMKKREEYCTLTKKPTGSDIKCDVGFEDCPEYKAAQEPIKPPKAHTVTPRGKLIQTSVFGAAGEKPFGV